MSNVTSRWEAGKGPEVGFWEHYLRTKGSKWPEEFESNLNPEQPLQEHVTRLIDAPPGAEVSILDAGAGPLSQVGKRWEGRKVKLTAVDPLADEYDRILTEVGIVPPVRTQRGEVEQLTELFPTNHFDLVHMRNALDHSYDPLRGIWQMLAVVKPGCCVLLLHHANEAEGAGYEGLHQWNLCAESSHFVVWNRETRFSVNDSLGDAARITVKQSERPHGLADVLVCELWKEIPSE
jgi:SAM-dependent methyltransferase